MLSQLSSLPEKNVLRPEALKPFGFRIKTTKEPAENEPRLYLAPLLRPVRWHSLVWMGKRERGEKKKTQSWVRKEIRMEKGVYRRNWGRGEYARNTYCKMFEELIKILL